jgi:autotransporter-associated beta strand protein
MAVVALLLPFGPDLSAQWKASGPGPFQYDDPANWEGGMINDQLTGSPEAEQTINFTTDRSMPDGLLIRQPTSSEDRHFSVNFKARNAKNSAPEARRLAVAGKIVVDLGKTNDVTAFFGDNVPVSLDFENGPAVIETVTGNSHVQIRGSLFNASGLVKKGEGRLTLSGRGLGVSGEIQVDGGWLNLSGKAALSEVARIVLSPVAPARISCLTLANEDQAMPDRLPDAVPIVCQGPALIRLTGRGGETSGETVGTISLNENCAEIWASASEGGAVDLTLTQLARAPGTLLVVGYESPQSPSRIRVIQDQAILDSLAGGQGGIGSTAASIVPWVRGHGGGNLHSAAGFLTYSHEDGFRELDSSSEYAQEVNSAKPVDNVRVAASGTSLAESKTINALYLDFPQGSGKETGLDLGGNTLTVSSGAISLGSEAQVANGTLTTGSDRPLIISGPVYMNARLEGTGGLIYFGGRYPELKLGAENSLTGDYVVAYGAIRLGDSESIPDTVTVRLQKGTELVVDGVESLSGLAGNGRVRFATRGQSSLVLGRSEGAANKLVVGQDGEIHPGDLSAQEPAIGSLLIWHPEDFKDDGSLEFQDGALCIDLAAEGSDRLILDSDNKAANINGGILRVNLLNGYQPKPGATWDIIVGTAPATGQGFEQIEDVTGQGYEYSAKPIGNKWVLELVTAP